MKARRAILRSPLDRIGYGGYLKLASEWPGFIEQIEKVVGEFRQIHEAMEGTSSYMAPFKVANLKLLGRTAQMDVQPGSPRDLAQGNLFLCGGD